MEKSGMVSKTLSMVDEVGCKGSHWFCEEDETNDNCDHFAQRLNHLSDGGPVCVGREGGVNEGGGGVGMGMRCGRGWGVLGSGVGRDWAKRSGGGVLT